MTHDPIGQDFDDQIIFALFKEYLVNNDSRKCGMNLRQARTRRAEGWFQTLTLLKVIFLPTQLIKILQRIHGQEFKHQSYWIGVAHATLYFKSLNMVHQCS